MARTIEDCLFFGVLVAAVCGHAGYMDDVMTELATKLLALQRTRANA